MSEREQEVERDDEGLVEVTEAFHESRAAAKGELTRVDVEAVHVRDDHSAICLEVTSRAGDEWLLFRSDATLHRGDLLDRFEGVDGLDELADGTWEVYLDREEGVVRPSADGRELGTIHDEEPEVMVLPSGVRGKRRMTRTPKEEPFTEANACIGDLAEFDRLARVEATMEGRPPTTGVELSVEGVDGDRVRATASIDDSEFEWVFDVPGPHEFEDSNLTRLVEAVDAGDPAGLDGHRVQVGLESELSPGTMRFPCEEGTVAIAPGVEGETSIADSGADGSFDSVDISTLVTALALLGGGMAFEASFAIAAGSLLLAAWATRAIVE